MNIIINLSLLLGAYIGALVITKVFEWCDRQVAMREYKKGQFYQKKIKRLHDNAFYYYYDMMQTDPVRLSYELASRDINQLKRTNKIDFLYRKLAK